MLPTSEFEKGGRVRRTPVRRRNRTRRLALCAVLLACAVILACESSPTGPEDLYEAALECMHEGAFEEAAHIWHEALAMGSVDTAFVYTGLGVCCAYLDSLGPSRAYLEAALGADSTMAAAWCALAFVNAALGDAEGSLAALLCAKELLDPGGPGLGERGLLVADGVDLEILLAQVYFRLGRYEESGAVLSGVSADAPDPQDPATWSGHPSYVQALLVAIEEITALRIAEKEQSLLPQTPI